MRRFKFRRRSFARTVRRVRPFVRAVTGISLVKRVNISTAVTIPDATAGNFDNPLEFDILACREAIDEEIESTGGTTPGTDVADCPVYSRVTGLRLNFLVQGGDACVIRWLLYKMPDGEQIFTQLAGGFHNSNDTPTDREARKYTMAKGHIIVGTSNLASPLRVHVSKEAMKRVSPMRENDRLRMVIAKSNTAAAATLTGFGSIYLRANG